jgi:hypothetical protein
VAQVRFNDAHNVIVNAISEDLRMVEDFDYHDPLGIAFYVYGLLKTGYTNLVLDSFPHAARFWVEEKVSAGVLSPYMDRDLAAIGLITFALCKYRTCPKMSGEKLISLIEPHFDDNRGLFSSFLTTVLVGLGLKALIPQPGLYDRFADYINDQIKNHTNTIFNDPKTLVVAHLWATETQARGILQIVRHECMVRASSRDCLPRERVYLSYVLLEEANCMPRPERSKVKQWIEESLRFVQIYSIESGFASAIVEQYSYDVVSKPEVMEQYGHSARPRLSRIMLSVGLMLERQYSSSARLLFSRQIQLESISRGTVYPLFLLILTALIFWLWRQVDVPLSLKSALESKSLKTTLVAFCFQFPIDFIWAATIVVPLISAWVFFHRLALTGQRSSELEVMHDIWGILRKNWLIEVVLAIIMSVVVAFFV